jgi:hypothetical protein
MIDISKHLPAAFSSRGVFLLDPPRGLRTLYNFLYSRCSRPPGSIAWLRGAPTSVSTGATTFYFLPIVNLIGTVRGFPILRVQWKRRCSSIVAISISPLSSIMSRYI